MSHPASASNAGAAPSATMLGIETSCDETAVAVVRGMHAPDGQIRSTILSNIVLSQTDDHAAFGGVVPEIAARAHAEALDDVIAAALERAEIGLPEIDAIAATAGPGLIGGLIVGTMTARAMALAADKPYLPINHLEGHALTARLTDRVAFPYLLLLVSGGHTQILVVEGVGRYRRLASTIDDALGEAFDKTAKLLGLPYPGGPNVEAAAKTGDAKRFNLPRPLRGEDRLAFSFSGLKTAVRLAAESVAPLGDEDVADLCAGFQAAVSDTLVDRTALALDLFAGDYPDTRTPTLVVAGGVAANQHLRHALEELCDERHFALIAPPIALCGDNGAMIAHAGLERWFAGLLMERGEAMSMPPRSRWPLDETAEPMVGSGKRGAKA